MNAYLSLNFIHLRFFLEQKTGEGNMAHGTAESQSSDEEEDGKHEAERTAYRIDGMNERKKKDKKEKRQKNEHRKEKKTKRHKKEKKTKKEDRKKRTTSDDDDSQSRPTEKKMKTKSTATRDGAVDDDTTLLSDSAAAAIQSSLSSSIAAACCPSLPRVLVESSALPPSSASAAASSSEEGGVTLVLFYQYVEPPWSDGHYRLALKTVERIGRANCVLGRMRVAKEGLNCTLTGAPDNVRAFCHALRHWDGAAFNSTEFKLTHDLSPNQAFRELKVIPVTELVHYGLEMDKAPTLQTYSGTHLEPVDYHAKLARPDTVVIDVRNHYEAAIGHFDAPQSQFLDPRMRKSTEFPVWLDSPETRDQLRGKNVLMVCACRDCSACFHYVLI
jgi:UPF0176 acylphosphatase like domain